MSARARDRENRIIQLLKYIRDEDQALTITEIFNILEREGLASNRKAVERSIERLSIKHGVCSTERGVNRYFLAKDYKLTYDLSLSAEALQTLMIALNQLKTCSHPYFKDMATEAQLSITEVLNRDIVEELQETATKYYFDYGLKGVEGSNREDFEKLLYALRENRSFSCENRSPYKSKKERKEIKRYAPVVFILSANIPYMIVQDLDNNSIKKLRLSRVHKVKLLDYYNTDAIRQTLNLENMIGGWGGVHEDSELIEIECKEIMGTYFMEQKIHPAQKVSKLKNGNYKITLNCAPSSEIGRLLSSFSDQIISISPKYLQEDVIDIWRRGIEALDKAA